MPATDETRDRIKRAGAAHRRAEARLEATRSELYQAIAEGRRGGLSVREVAGIAQVGNGTVQTAERAGA